MEKGPSDGFGVTSSWARLLRVTHPISVPRRRMPDKRVRRLNFLSPPEDKEVLFPSLSLIRHLSSQLLIANVMEGEKKVSFV